MSYRTVSMCRLGGAFCAISCALLVACVEARDDGLNRGGGEGCEYCHSDIDRIGAHARHVRGEGEYGAKYACTECHPATEDSFLEGEEDLVHAKLGVGFSEGALSGLADDASFDADEKKCSNVYCHGATLEGGGHTEPTWENDDELLDDHAQCEDCHGLPPDTSDHEDVDDTSSCVACHADAYRDDLEDESGRSAADLLPGVHINGELNSIMTDEKASARDFGAQP